MKCPLYYVHIIEENRHNLFLSGIFTLLREANKAGKGTGCAGTGFAVSKGMVRESITEKGPSKHCCEDSEGPSHMNI